MLEIITALTPYAPVLIFTASALDIFFGTGFLLYGWAMMGSVAAMHASGVISPTVIVLSAFAGTLFGNLINYTTGRLFAKTKFVAKKLRAPKIKTARDFFKSRGLFIFMLASRFFTFTRPLYALLLGSLHTDFRRFLAYELVIALFWVIFWLFIILQGENLYFYLFG